MSSEPGTSVEILAVGRELLTGRTVDSNSAWIAARLCDRGTRVARIVVVDDDPAAIAREIASARARGVPLVVTTGGLGPTADDRTLAGLAAALGRGLARHPGAVAFVARRYAELAAAGAVSDAALTPAREKMAVLPAGAEPIDNPIGSAPGVLVVDGPFAVVALPGVPAEMRAVLDAALPRLAPHLGTPEHVVEREIDSGVGDESVLTAALDRVRAAVPGVHLKSLATAFSPTCDLRVRVTAVVPDRDDAEARVREAVARLRRELASPPARPGRPPTGGAPS
jgi:molybdenum cofactor synthesis domain-containing protein